MSNKRYLIKKEICELWKSKKILIIATVSILIAGISPFLAKYMSDLLSLLASTSGQEVAIVFPEPVVSDAYAQLFKNISTIGMFVYILAFCGTVVEERKQGTATLILTKNVTRVSFIACKYIAIFITFLGVYIIMGGIFGLYTTTLFEDFALQPFVVSMLSYLLYCFLIISITILFSTISKNMSIAAMLSIVVFFVTDLGSYVPYVGDYLPGSIKTAIIHYIGGVSSRSSLVWLSIENVIGILLISMISCIIFNKQESV